MLSCTHTEDKTSFDHQFKENNIMLFHRQARWLAIRTLAKTSLHQPNLQRSVVHLSPQGNHGTTPLIGLFSKLLTTKHNWRPIRQFAAKSRDGDELTDETSETSKCFSLMQWFFSEYNMGIPRLTISFVRIQRPRNYN